jgi:hypothetical protein
MTGRIGVELTLKYGAPRLPPQGDGPLEQRSALQGACQRGSLRQQRDNRAGQGYRGDRQHCRRARIGLCRQQLPPESERRQGDRPFRTERRRSGGSEQIHSSHASTVRLSRSERQIHPIRTMLMENSEGLGELIVGAVVFAQKSAFCSASHGRASSE